MSSLFKKLFILLLSLTVAFAAVGCDGCNGCSDEEGDDTPDTSIVTPATPVINMPESVNLIVGDFYPITPTTQNVTGDLTWTSTNPAIASVDEYGRVSAIEEGSSEVTATFGEVSATCTVNVSYGNYFPELQSYSGIIEEENQLISFGSDYHIAPYFFFNNKIFDVTQNDSITYTSSDESVLTVSDDGVITPLKSGQSTISIEANWRNKFNAENCSSLVKSVNVTVSENIIFYINETELPVDMDVETPASFQEESEYNNTKNITPSISVNNEIKSGVTVDVAPMGDTVEGVNYTFDSTTNVFTALEFGKVLVTLSYGDYKTNFIINITRPIKEITDTINYFSAYLGTHAVLDGDSYVSKTFAQSIWNDDVVLFDAYQDGTQLTVKNNRVLGLQINNDSTVQTRILVGTKTECYDIPVTAAGAFFFNPEDVEYVFNQREDRELNGYFLVMQDIDMTGFVVGKKQTVFKGVFDGQGFVISNIGVETAPNNVTFNRGMFGELYGTVKNTAFINMYNASTSGITWAYYFSPFAAIARDGANIENMYIEFNLTSDAFAAGLCRFTGGAKIKNLVLINNLPKPNVNESFISGKKYTGSLGWEFEKLSGYVSNAYVITNYPLTYSNNGYFIYGENETEVWYKGFEGYDENSTVQNVDSTYKRVMKGVRRYEDYFDISLDNDDANSNALDAMGKTDYWYIKNNMPVFKGIYDRYYEEFFYPSVAGNRVSGVYEAGAFQEFELDVNLFGDSVDEATFTVADNEFVEIVDGKLKTNKISDGATVTVNGTFTYKEKSYTTSFQVEVVNPFDITLNGEYVSDTTVDVYCYKESDLAIYFAGAELEGVNVTYAASSDIVSIADGKLLTKTISADSNDYAVITATFTYLDIEFTETFNVIVLNPFEIHIKGSAVDGEITINYLEQHKVSTTVNGESLDDLVTVTYETEGSYLSIQETNKISADMVGQGGKLHAKFTYTDGTVYDEYVIVNVIDPVADATIVYFDDEDASAGFYEAVLNTEYKITLVTTGDYSIKSINPADSNVLTTSITTDKVTLKANNFGSTVITIEYDVNKVVHYKDITVYAVKAIEKVTDAINYESSSGTILSTAVAGNVIRATVAGNVLTLDNGGIYLVDDVYRFRAKTSENDTNAGVPFASTTVGYKNFSIRVHTDEKTLEFTNVNYFNHVIETPQEFLEVMDRTKYAPLETKDNVVNDRLIALGNDIDMTDYVLSNAKGTKFTGIFDGQGYVVSNLTVMTGSANLAPKPGLFGELDGTVKNVAFLNLQDTGNRAWYYSPFGTTTTNNTVIKNVYLDIVLTSSAYKAGSIRFAGVPTIENLVQYVNFAKPVIDDKYLADQYGYGSLSWHVEKTGNSKIDNIYVISEYPINYRNSNFIYAENETELWYKGFNNFNENSTVQSTQSSQYTTIMKNVRRYNNDDEFINDNSDTHLANLEAMKATGMWEVSDNTPIFKSVYQRHYDNFFKTVVGDNSNVKDSVELDAFQEYDLGVKLFGSNVEGATFTVENNDFVEIVDGKLITKKISVTSDDVVTVNVAYTYRSKNYTKSFVVTVVDPFEITFNGDVVSNETVNINCYKTADLGLLFAKDAFTGTVTYTASDNKIAISGSTLTANKISADNNDVTVITATFTYENVSYNETFNVIVDDSFEVLVDNSATTNITLEYNTEHVLSVNVNGEEVADVTYTVDAGDYISIDGNTVSADMVGENAVVKASFTYKGVDFVRSIVVNVKDSVADSTKILFNGVEASTFYEAVRSIGNNVNKIEVTFESSSESAEFIALTSSVDGIIEITDSNFKGVTLGNTVLTLEFKVGELSHYKSIEVLVINPITTIDTKVYYDASTGVIHYAGLEGETISGASVGDVKLAIGDGIELDAGVYKFNSRVSAEDTTAGIPYVDGETGTQKFELSIYTENDTYKFTNVLYQSVIIYTPEQFMEVMDRNVYAPENENLKIKYNKLIALGNDLDMTGFTFANTKGIRFVGAFDGQGYVVSNLSAIAQAENSNGGHGLFGVVAGTVKNVAFTNLIVVGSAWYFSPFSSSTENSAVIENVYVEIVDSSSKTYSGMNKAGLGRLSGSPTIKNVVISYNDGVEYDQFVNYAGSLTWNDADRQTNSSRIDNIYVISNLPLNCDSTGKVYYGENEEDLFANVTNKAKMYNVRRYSDISDVSADTNQTHIDNLKAMVETGMWVNVNGAPVFKGVYDNHYTNYFKLRVGENVNATQLKVEAYQEHALSVELFGSNVEGATFTVPANDFVEIVDGKLKANAVSGSESVVVTATFTYNNAQTTCNFKVSVVNPFSATLNGESVSNKTVHLNCYKTAELAVAFSNTTIDNVTFTSSSDIVSIDGTTLTANKISTSTSDYAVITASFNYENTDFTETFNVIVDDPFALLLDGVVTTSKTLDYLDVATLSATVNEVALSNVTFTVVDGDYISIADNKLTANRAGSGAKVKATFTYNSVDFERTISVDVKDDVASSTVISFNNTAVTSTFYEVIKSTQANANVITVALQLDGEYEFVRLTSSVDGIVEINDNTYEPVGLGSTVLTVEYKVNGVTHYKSIEVSVINPVTEVEDVVDYEASTGTLIYSALEGKKIVSATVNGVLFTEENGGIVKVGNVYTIRAKTSSTDSLVGVPFIQSKKAIESSKFSSNKLNEFVVTTEDDTYKFSNVYYWTEVITTAEEFVNALDWTKTPYKSNNNIDFTGGGLYINGWYRLGADIDMANAVFTGEGPNGLPYNFSLFDGANHSIYNLAPVNTVFGIYYGKVSNVKFINLTGNLFHKLAVSSAKGTIENVYVEGANVTGIPSKAANDANYVATNFTWAQVSILADETPVSSIEIMKGNTLTLSAQLVTATQGLTLSDFSVVSAESNLVSVNGSQITADNDTGSTTVNVTYKVGELVINLPVKVTVIGLRVTVETEVDFEVSTGTIKYQALEGKTIKSLKSGSTTLTPGNGIVDNKIMAKMGTTDQTVGLAYVNSSNLNASANKLSFVVETDDDAIYTFTNIRYWNEVIETPEEFTAAFDKTVSPYQGSTTTAISGSGIYMFGWFKLACDIDMTGVPYSGDTSANGLPYNRSFFDGYGHTVSNLTVTGKQAFGMIYFAWKNVNFVNYTGTLFQRFDNGSKITNVYMAKAGATGKSVKAANNGTVTETNVVWADVDTLIDGVATSANDIKIPLNTDTEIALKLNASSVENAEITNVSITALDNNVVVEGNNIKLIDMAGGKVKVSYEIAGFTVSEIITITVNEANA